MQTPRQWAEARFRAYVDEGTAVRLRDLDPLTVVACALARPRGFRRLIACEWAWWTVLPGDRFEDFQLAEAYEVLAVKPDHVIAWATPEFDPTHGGTVKAWRPSRPPRLFYRSGERCMSSWVPLND